jgi:hypothetical protein
LIGFPIGGPYRCANAITAWCDDTVWVERRLDRRTGLAARGHQQRPVIILVIDRRPSTPMPFFAKACARSAISLFSWSTRADAIGGGSGVDMANGRFLNDFRKWESRYICSQDHGE